LPTFVLFPIDIKDDPVIYAIPVFIVLMLIEGWVNYREQRHLFEKKDTISSLLLGIGSVIIDLPIKAIFYIVFSFIHQYSLFPNIAFQWWAWLLCFFADDFTFYWFHRTAHSVRLIWCAHSNHHSAKTINWAVALRQSWTELFFKYFFWIPMAFIGFHPLMIFIMQSFSLIYQFWPHTVLIKKLPAWFEFIFNTPSHHRVHHASNIRYLDRNHAGTLIIWDRLFGTFEAEREEEAPVYGITKNIDPILGNPLKITFHEYADLWQDIRRAKGLKAALGYIFMAPGWHHDGNDQRTETLRRRFLQD
jgi:sterol desaturase/sphingolipid hydroxylase (fatty acid hydroxylase superfamily)